MKKQSVTFFARWALNTLGLWVAVRLLGSGYNEIQPEAGLFAFILAGLVFSIVNSIIRPIVVILSLPAILLTLGLFTIIVNGLMVYISLKISPGLSMTFLNSIFAGILLSLVNYIVSSVLELRSKNTHEEKS